jgi:UDP-N-acetylglucosamine acyltransferase
MLGGSCGVSKDIPPFCLVKPLEGNTIMGLNSVGLRRSTLSKKDRQEIKEAFKLLYLSGLNISHALEKIKSAYPSGPASEFSTFIDKSERGICVM